MRTYNRNYLAACVILLCSLAVIIQIDSVHTAPRVTRKLADFPLNVAQWQGKDIPLQENVYVVLGTRDVVVREYTDPQGAVITLAVIYSDSDRSSFHPPEICYLGGGEVQLRDKKIETITYGAGVSLAVNTLVMEQKKSMLKAWYWFAARGVFTPSFYVQQLSIMRNWLRYKTKEGALIRVSASLDPADPSLAESKAQQFIREITPILEAFFKST